MGLAAQQTDVRCYAHLLPLGRLRTTRNRRKAHGSSEPPGMKIPRAFHLPTAGLTPNIAKSEPAFKHRPSARGLPSHSKQMPFAAEAVFSAKLL